MRGYKIASKLCKITVEARKEKFDKERRLFKLDKAIRRTIYNEKRRINMKIEVLISTMQQVDYYKFLENMKIQSDAVIINQCDTKKKINFKYKGFNILWIDTLERGLSNSRNMAIKNSSADICIFADDDEELRSGYVQIIEESFEENKDYQILRFKVEGVEKPFKQYPEKSFQIGFFKSLKVSSVEIAFRRNAILEGHIEFDPFIGAGTKFPMGEENAFLFQCLQKKLKIRYVPKTIADLHIGTSTWFTGYNKRYFVGRGAAFTSMSEWGAPILILQFAIRKRKIYKKELSVYRAIRYMFQGRKEYIAIKSKKF